MFFKKIIILSLFLFVLLGGFVILYDFNDTLKIGIMVPKSGDLISRGNNVLDVLNLSFTEINLNSGINGKLVELLVIDSKCSRQGGVDAGEKFVELGVDIVVGGVCDEAVFGAVDIFNENRILFISSSSGHSRLTIEDDFIFRNRPSNLVFIEGIVNIVLRGNHSSVGIIYDSESVGESLIFDIESGLKNGGLEVFTSSFILGDDDSINDFIGLVKNENLESILFLVDSDINLKYLLSKLETYNLGLPKYSNDIILNSNFVFFRDFLEGTKFPSFSYDLENPKSFYFINKFSKTYSKNIFMLDTFFNMAVTYDLPFILNKSLEGCDFEKNISICAKQNLENFPGYGGVIDNYSFDKYGDLIYPISDFIYVGGESLLLKN